MKSVVIGTAGHIDHGKSSLVKALTGTDPDRFAEEQRRGITIDLGFAFLETDELSLSFVDVPGHERLVKHMIAGAVGFDIALICVDAREGIKPQTVEHANILAVLGVSTVVLAATKSDRASKTRIIEVLDEAERLLDHLGFSRITKISTSIFEADSIAALKDVLVAEANRITPKNSSAPFLLRIDRSFSIKGFGAVITGTASFGTVHVGDTVHLMPKNRPVRIKGVQVHGASVSSATAGDRAALNLGGINASDTGRGDLLTAAPLTASDTMAASVAVFSHLPENLSIRHNATYPLFIGTRQLNARIIIPGGGRIEPGQRRIVTCKLDEPYAAFCNEPFVLRGGSPQQTVAGGQVLAVDRMGLKPSILPEYAARVHEGDWPGAIHLILTHRPFGIALPPAVQMTGQDEVDRNDLIAEAGGTVVNDVLVSGTGVADTVDGLLGRLDEAGELSAQEIDRTVKSYPDAVKDVVKKKLFDAARDKGFAPTGGGVPSRRRDPIEDEADAVESLMNDDFTLSNAPLIAEKTGMAETRTEQVLTWLANRGRVKKLAPGVFVTKNVLARFEEQAAMIAKQDGFVEVKNIRSAFDAPRKLLIPLLEHLDTTGRYVTRERRRYLKS